MHVSAVAGRWSVLALLGVVGMVAVLALTLIGPPMAVGQATRTWVSGVGDDANPCSRTAPCKTFAGAISKTASGGEINCLDPGGFGSLTITKSIIIDCTGTLGGVLAAGGGINGIVINLPAASDLVSLRGLDINGAGSAQNGIRIVGSGQVDLQDLVIRGFRATNGLGMSVQPSGALELNVRNTTVFGNGSTSSGAGMLIQPTGGGGSAQVTLNNVGVSNNFQGLRIDTAGNSSATGVDVMIFNSSFTAHTFHGIAAIAGGSPVDVMIDSSNISWNNTGGTGGGVTVSGAAALIRVGRSTITGNRNGTLQVSSGVIQSYQTNQIDGNVNDGTRTNINQN